MKFVVVFSVMLFCATWGAINLSHDALKKYELDLQAETMRRYYDSQKPGWSGPKKEDGKL
jgi:hypothetical protein